MDDMDKNEAKARMRDVFGDFKKGVEAPKKVELIGEHTVKEGETLSHIALKYYGNAARDYFMVIYEANKEVIGKDPGLIKAGMKLKISVLPDALKKK